MFVIVCFNLADHLESNMADPTRERTIAEYRKKINEHQQVEAKLKAGKIGGGEF